MSSREIKTCAGCSEDDMILLGKSYCDDCLEKRRLDRKKILTL